MTKWCSIRRCLGIRISTYFFIALGIYSTFYVLFFYECYNYDHVDRADIDAVLYKKVHHTMLKEGRLNCTYDSILQSTRTIHAWDVPKDYDDFVAHGIADGGYAPHQCNPLFSVAIIVTYRNRTQLLNVFLLNIHNFLRKQYINYKIYLVEQDDDLPWNKGLLYNLGARQAIIDKFLCLILHDVDLIPLDESNLYVCTVQPRHLSTSIDKFRFILPYPCLVGGVLAIMSHQFDELNGFSNRFLDWGGEDDDFAARIAAQNLTVLRFPREMSRYTMLPHRSQPRNPERLRLLREDTSRAAARDGLRFATYQSLRLESHQLFTLLRVKTCPTEDC